MVKCKIQYNLIKDDDKLNCCYNYRGFYYLPERRRMLRYSPSGMVTEDYECRLTIMVKNKNNLELSYEKSEKIDKYILLNN